MNFRMKSTSKTYFVLRQRIALLLVNVHNLAGGKSVSNLQAGSSVENPSVEDVKPGPPRGYVSQI